MLFKKIIPALLVLNLLAGCNSSEDNISKSKTFSSIQEAFSIISKNQNYTLEVDYYNNDNIADSTIYFTKDAYFVEEINYKYGYIQDKKGVYFIDLYRNKLIPSKFLKNENNEAYTNLWESNLFSSFKNFDVDKIIFENEKYIIKDKTLLLQYLDILHIEAANYSLIKNLNIEYLNETSYN